MSLKNLTSIKPLKKLLFVPVLALIFSCEKEEGIPEKAATARAFSVEVIDLRQLSDQALVAEVFQKIKNPTKGSFADKAKLSTFAIDSSRIKRLERNGRTTYIFLVKRDSMDLEASRTSRSSGTAATVSVGSQGSSKEDGPDPAHGGVPSPGPEVPWPGGVLTLSKITLDPHAPFLQPSPVLPLQVDPVGQARFGAQRPHETRFHNQQVAPFKNPY